MALNPSNSSNLEQLSLKRLKCSHTEIIDFKLCIKFRNGKLKFLGSNIINRADCDKPASKLIMFTAQCLLGKWKQA